ncbi:MULTISPECIES: hypothetical protein [Fodinibius]|uniref:DUF3553 domain-containing protein n=2 Tax=Fodinibius TaxID=1397106 RepID=A0A1M4ZG24_9BACT|nr:MULTISPECIES: hypothetical protein [Fodinibius]SHF16742.1 hypothetical protein SAMN05443144_10616 [Fodinibius roseus]SMO82040.1 hypothetical protein SAMN06265218_11569 [Fodinibius sediminis]
MATKKRLSYRLDRLPVIYPFNRRADNNIQLGDLVYYGPSPEYYGIGEVVRCVEGHCIVDFRGTGMLNIEKDALAMKYLIPIHKLNLGHILKST